MIKIEWWALWWYILCICWLWLHDLSMYLWNCIELLELYTKKGKRVSFTVCKLYLIKSHFKKSEVAFPIFWDQMHYDMIWFLTYLKNILKLCTMPTSIIVVNIIRASVFVFVFNLKK